MSGSKKTTQKTTVDPATLAQQSRLYAATNAQAGMGGAALNPYSMMAAGQYANAAGAMNLGLGAMTGDPAAMSRFMNPYQSQVMDAMNAQNAITQRQTMNNVASQAQQAGAFGGSRYGVALGTAAAQAARDQAAQQAQLLQSGYQNAQNMAGQVANFGMGATNQMANMGDYMRNVQLQNQGYATDTLRNNMYQGGQTTTNTSKGNPISGALGGAISGFAATGSPWGAAAGAGMGLFG